MTFHCIWIYLWNSSCSFCASFSHYSLHPILLQTHLGLCFLPLFCLPRNAFCQDSTCPEPTNAPQHEETSFSLELPANLPHDPYQFPVLPGASGCWLECFPPNFLICPWGLRPHGTVEAEHLEFRPGSTYSPVPFFSFKDIFYPLHQHGVDQMPKESPELMLTKSSWELTSPPGLFGVSFKELHEMGPLDWCGHADLGWLQFFMWTGALPKIFAHNPHTLGVAVSISILYHTCLEGSKP